MSPDSHGAETRPPAWLLGRWRLLHASQAIGILPGTRMEFGPDGALSYIIPVEDTEQVVALVYRIDGDVLRTENPLAPHATATPFRRGPGDTLVLDFADSPVVLVREQDGERGW